jgi:hypothetical protein
MRRPALPLLLLSILAACQTASTTGGASPTTPPGTERGECRAGGACDPGLLCLSQRCVRPPEADCAKVVAALGEQLLGNYAEEEERARFAADTQAACARLHLSAEDGACLLHAKGRAEIGRCPHPLGVGDCAAISRHLASLAGTQGADPYLVTGADRLASRCKNEIPTLALERCVLAAKSVAELEPCRW